MARDRGHVSDQDSAVKDETIAPLSLRPVLLVSLAAPVGGAVIDDVDLFIDETLWEHTDQLLYLSPIVVQLAPDVLDLVELQGDKFI